MYLKAEVLIIKYRGDSIAHVDLRVNPLGLRLKANVELSNGDSFVMKSNGYTNDQFKNNLKKECYRRLGL